MSKIMVPSTCCKIGDIVADYVLDDNGISLVTENTVVNQYIKN